MAALALKDIICAIFTCMISVSYVHYALHMCFRWLTLSADRGAVKNEWTKLDTTGHPIGRFAHASILCGDWLFVHGGTNNRRVLSDIQVINLLPEHRHWFTIQLASASVPIARCAVCFVVLTFNFLFLCV